MRWLALALLAGPAAAQVELPFSIEATEACLAEGGTDCVGKSAGDCIDSPDGYTTVGMGICLGRELDYWDARLNAAYQALLDLEAGNDRFLDEVGSAAPRTVPALREMQRSWIAFRDAACAYERAQWGGGTGGGPATVGCLMHETARQALALEARAADMKAR